MSAITLERPPVGRPPVEAVPGVRGGERGRRPVVAGEAAGAVPGARRHVGADRRAARALRVTRRGRLARTLASVAIIALLVSVVVARWSATPEPVVDHATTVRAGQTLSEVAAEQLPGVPLRESVAALQVVNGMNSTAVTAGQSVLVPRL